MKIVSYRTIELLGQLTASSAPISVRELSARLGVSERTVRYGLAELRSSLSEAMIEIESVPGKGIQLPARFHARASEVLDFWRRDCGFERAYKNSVERSTAIATEVIAGRGARTVEHWSKWLGVIRSTCLRDLASARGLLAEWGLCIEPAGRSGILVTSPEEEIREALWRLIIQLIPGDRLLAILIRDRAQMPTKSSPTRYAYINEVLEPSRMALVIDAVMDVLEEYDFRPSDNDVVTSLVKILVASARCAEGYLLEAVHGASGAPRAREIALRLIAVICGDDLPLSIREVEASYLLSLLPDREKGGEWLCTCSPDRTTEDVIGFVLERVRAWFGGRFLHDQHLIKLFRLHLASAISRARIAERVDNPLRDTIIAQYPIPFDRCTSLFHEVDRRFGVSLDANEIAFVAMYVAAARDEEGGECGQTDLRVTLICGYGYGTVALLRRSLSRRLPWIHVAEQISVFEALDHRYDNVDIVLTTVEVPVPLPIPMIRVSPVLSESDVRKIKSFAPWRGEDMGPRLEDVLSIVHRYCEVQNIEALELDLKRLLKGRGEHREEGDMSLPSLREVVLRQRTLANAVCSDWDDVVSRAASVLFNDPMQAGEWGTDVRNIQKEYGQMSILPHGVCMPHGYPRSSYSLSMTLISLADPVVLHLPTGCEEIRLIMAVAAPNNEIQARMLDELFCLLEEGAELVDRLTEAQNSDELYERFIEQYERRFP